MNIIANCIYKDCTVTDIHELLNDKLEESIKSNFEDKIVPIIDDYFNEYYKQNNLEVDKEEYKKNCSNKVTNINIDRSKGSSVVITYTIKLNPYNDKYIRFPLRVSIVVDNKNYKFIEYYDGITPITI
jgi:hypothetical protein